MSNDYLIYQKSRQSCHKRPMCLFLCQSRDGNREAGEVREGNSWGRIEIDKGRGKGMKSRVGRKMVGEKMERRSEQGDL